MQPSIMELISVGEVVSFWFILCLGVLSVGVLMKELTESNVLAVIIPVLFFVTMVDFAAKYVRGEEKIYELCNQYKILDEACAEYLVSYSSSDYKKIQNEREPFERAMLELELQKKKVKEIQSGIQEKKK